MRRRSSESSAERTPSSACGTFSPAAAIKAAGGKVIMEKSIIVGVGALMFFQDTEGNSFGVIQPDAKAE